MGGGKKIAVMTIKAKKGVGVSCESTSGFTERGKKTALSKETCEKKKNRAD